MGYKLIQLVKIVFVKKVTNFITCKLRRIHFITHGALQITPIAPINSKAYTNLVTSVILPGTSKVCIIPSEFNKDMLITLDGEHETYENVQEISTEIRKEKIKCLRFKDSNFSRRVNEKLLSKQ